MRNLLIFFVILSSFALYPLVSWWQIERENQKALVVFEELCQPENIYIDGTFEDWNLLLNQIRTGNFSDKVHLRRWKKVGYDSEWPVPEHNQVLESESTVTFMDSDNEMVLRDLTLMERRMFYVMAEPLGPVEYCIQKIEPELYSFLLDTHS